MRAGEGRSSRCGRAAPCRPEGGKFLRGPGSPLGPWGSPAERALLRPPVRRVKRTFRQNVPSPAAFFQPLYSVHRGNFQVRGAGARGGARMWARDAGRHPTFFSALSFFGICSGFKFTHCVSNEQQKISFIFYCSFLFVLVSLIHG